MKRYFILDELDDIIDEGDNYNIIEGTYIILERNKLEGQNFRIVEVEIDGKLVQVTIIKKDATNSDANNVIKTVLQSLGDEYQVEVKFVNE